MNATQEGIAAHECLHLIEGVAERLIKYRGWSEERALAYGKRMALDLVGRGGTSVQRAMARTREGEADRLDREERRRVNEACEPLWTRRGR